MADTNHSPCIGRLEHHIHDIFLSVRVPGEEFVYSSSAELFNALEDYCDDQGMNESKPPLLVRGEAGSGKSALLANWLQRRQRNTARVRNTDEFIFWHAVGCSRQSTDVNSLMRRLMVDLKSRFELSREVSQSQERLSWDLPRFLDLASKRGKIIIVIDGLHRLNSHDGESGLNWLPLEFPPNVRIVLSASVSDDTGDISTKSQQLLSSSELSSPRRPRILTELERRHWQELRLKPLEKSVTHNIVESFLKKSIQMENAVLGSDPFLTSVDDTDADNDFDDKELQGFILFESQIEMILCHNNTSSPLFLKLLLRCLGWAATRGYDLWTLLDNWLIADSSEALLANILKTLEQGHTTSDEKKLAARNRCVDAGGLAALRMLYPWHPHFQRESAARESESPDGQLYSLENQRLKREGVISSSPVNSANYPRGRNGRTETAASAATRANTAVLAIGDPRWQSVTETADKRLNDARHHAQREIITLVDRAKVEARKTGDGSGMSFIDLILSSSMNKSSPGSAEARSMQRRTSGSMRNTSTGGEGEEGTNTTGGDDDMGFAEEGQEYSDWSLDRTNTLRSPKSPTHIGTDDELDQDQEEREPVLTVVTQDTDAEDGLEKLPLYLLGGRDSIGFGGLLGQALCLLLVARHGLTETELWYLLATLQNTDDSSLEKSLFGNEIRALVSVCYGYREQFQDVWRTSDNHVTGRLERKQLLKGMVKINPEFTKEDLNHLLDFLKFANDVSIDYLDLIKRIVRAEKDYRMNETAGTGVAGGGAVKKLISSALFGKDKYKNQSRSLDGDSFTEGSMPGGELGSQFSLGAVMEDALLSSLCAVGVLYSPDNQVLVLPPESDVLRQVVMDGYVGVAGPDSWHRRLIRYFQAQPNSLRRSEELPWHLQICRKWHTLKDTLVDLNTFEMMFEGELRDELLVYWCLLTEGQLYTSDEAQIEGNNNRQQISDNARIVMELDTSAALGLTEKETRKHLLRNQVAPFDIVEEYNRSVERWVASTNATSTRLTSILALISSFLVAYSRRPEHQPASFIRLAVDTTGLEQFGVNYANFGGVTLTADVLALGGTVGRKKDKPLLGYLSSMSRQDSQLYPYLRWMWIQFPWMALPHGGLQKIDINASDVISPDARIEEVGGGLAASTVPPGGLPTSPHRVPTASDILRKEYIHSKRYWAVKKNDPFIGPVVNTTETRRRATTKSSSMISSMSVSALESAAKSKADVSTVLKPHSKFRRDIQEGIEMSKDSPFSNPTLRSIHNNTMFPSVENALKEKVFREAEAKDHFSQTAPARFGGQIAICDLQEKIRRINEDEILKDSNIRRGGAMPSESELESLYTLEMDRVGRLRHIFDTVKAERKRRRKSMEDVHDKVFERAEIDEKVAASLMMGEMAITGLETRHQSLSDALDESKALNESYKKLMTFLDGNPPYTTLHVEAVEQQLVLARTQLEDLRNSRVSIYADIDRLEKLRANEFQNRTEEMAIKKALLRERVANQRKENNKLLESMMRMSAGSRADTFLTDDHSHGGYLHSAQDKSNRSLKQSPHVDNGINKIFGSGKQSISFGRNGGHRNDIILNTDDDELIDVSANAQFESLLQRTGVGSAEELLSRYRAAQRLHDSLRSHQNLAESRLSNLRTEYSDLCVAWGQAQLVAKTDEDQPQETSSHGEMEARYLDQKLFKTEMKASQLLRQTEKVALIINQIRSGVSHMAVILQSKEHLLHKLPGSSAPPVYSSDEDITRILSWCEERVIAINEALVLDSSKPVATDDTQPFNSRQAELAALVLGSLKKGNLSDGTSKSDAHPRKKVAGGMSQSVIMDSSKDASIVDLLGGVRILARDAGEKQYEIQVENAQAHRDQLQSHEDMISKGQHLDDTVDELQSYLTEALSSNKSKHALRKANLIEGKTLGKDAGLGWALDEFLGKEGEEGDGYKGRGKTKHSKALSEEVFDRAELKAMKYPKSNDQRNNSSNVHGHNKTVESNEQS